MRARERSRSASRYVSGATFEAQIGLLFNSIMSQIGFKVSINPQPWNRITELATKVNDTPNVTEVFYDVTLPVPGQHVLPAV